MTTTIKPLKKHSLWQKLCRISQRSLAWVRQDKQRTRRLCDTLQQWLRQSEAAPLRVLMLGEATLAFKRPEASIPLFTLPLERANARYGFSPLANTLLQMPCDLSRHSVLIVSLSRPLGEISENLSAELACWMGQFAVSGWRVIGSPFPAPDSPAPSSKNTASHFLASQCEHWLPAPLCWDALTDYLAQTPPPCWASWRGGLDITEKNAEKALSQKVSVG